MSMSSHVVGFRPPDDKWIAMKKVYDACTAASIRPPDEVREFFNYVTPDSNSVEVSLDNHPATKEYRKEGYDGFEIGFEIDLAKLPIDLKTIRFFNSY